LGRVEGEVALITGGNSGIGLATAKQSGNEGAHVFYNGSVVMRNWPRNVSNLSDLDRLFAQIMREKGKLDIVFANAGVAK
jgi:NAD(P)-dependent dehydrogenase (short-subunit alcohol dehydrogenase family)